LNPSDGTSSFSQALANGVGRLMAPARFRGKIRLANWLGGIAGGFTPEANCAPVPGARVTVSLSDRIGRMMWAGCYEPELLGLLRRVLGAGMTFVDVGAQIGYFSAAAAALVGSSGSVHSFEPDPDCFLMLQKNARAYPCMKTHNSAVADFTGETSFARTPEPGESGWGALFDEDGKRTKISVRVCTLDDWQAAERIERIDVLKIDVEGAECRVLEGARRAIDALKPLIWVEANGVCLARDGQSIASLLSALAEHGYEMRGVYGARSKSFDNVVAAPQEKRDLLERLERADLGLRAIPGTIGRGATARVSSDEPAARKARRA